MKKMNKYLSIVLTVLFTCGTLFTYNVSADELSYNRVLQNEFEEWFEGDCLVYPVRPGLETWKELSYIEQLEICEMPEELLVLCSDQMLADLVITYPFASDVVAYDSADDAINHFMATSNIFQKFFESENAMRILLDKFDNLVVDYNVLVEQHDVTMGSPITISGYESEMFLQYYFATVIDMLDNQQLTKLSEIMGDKYQQKQGICEDFSTALALYSQTQLKFNEIPTEIIPNNILENFLDMDMVESNLSGFNPDGGYGYVPSLDADVWTGTYTKYSETVDCWQYKSGEYTTAEKNDLNSEFQTDHPGWTYLYSSTKKYNCHSYGWILQSPQYNSYWLNDPTGFTSSSQIFYKGSNCSSQKYDRIMLYNGSSLKHTIITYSAGINKYYIFAESKFGQQGVYRTTLNEAMVFYGCSTYKVYDL